jgi:nicotinamidase-related amidase
MDTRLFSHDTLLVVVDVQERLMAAMDPAAAASLSRNVSTLIHAAAAVKAPVICTEQYPKGLGPTVAEVKQALADAPVMAKVDFSCVRHPGFLDALNTSRKRRVLVVGAEAHVCVALTARDLIQEGFIVSVPHDACLSRRAADHAAALDLMRQSGVAITTTETVALDWMGSSTHPAFKDISRRIK